MTAGERPDPQAVSTGIGGGSLWPALTAADAPPPTARSLDDALVMLDAIERGAIEVFERHGLPSRPGLYRSETASGEWRLMEEAVSAEARWLKILEHPPEAGFKYLSLADVGRTSAPAIAEVQTAAATLDRCYDLRHLLSDTNGEEASPALLMFWSTVELMAVIFNGSRRNDGRAAARRAVEWQIWRAEADRIWQAEPTLSLRSAARRVVERLGLSESHHSVRRRLTGFRPPSPT